MDTRNFLPVIRQCKAKRKLGDTLALRSCDDFQRLDDAGDRLVLQAGVFAFSVLADDAEVYVFVAGFEAGYVFDEDDRGVDVEFLAEGDVEGDVAAAGDGGVEDA